MAQSQTSQRHRRRSVRRWIVRAVVFLLLGVVVNVVVAWGYSSQTFYNEFAFAQTVDLSTETSNNLWNMYAPERWPAGRVSGTRCQFRGFEIDIVGLDDDPQVSSIHVTRQGWPCIALRGAVAVTNAPVNPPTLVEHDRFCLISPDDFYGIDRLALQPVWPGFAINTILYGVILWLLVATPFALRNWRRVRKGLCPKCGYPAGTSDICTECGTRLKSVSPAEPTEEPSP